MTARKRLPFGDPRHGTRNGYARHRCRCWKCIQANTVTCYDNRYDREAKGLPVDDPRHGEYSTYVNWNCRCEACRQAGSERNRQNYLRRKGLAR